MQIRKPAVAGQFYPLHPAQIIKQIEGFLPKNTVRINAYACMLPHAGYIYSGRVACETVNAVNLKDTIILIGPNHTGLGKPFSIMTEGIWQTPLGEVKIAGSLAKEILKNSRFLKEDSQAHQNEHSLEVELPILQYFKKTFQIIPIAISSEDGEILKKIGSEIAEAVKNSELKNSVMLIASSDMTHYEPKEIAEKKDRAAIEAILELDENKLIRKIKEYSISMCGYAPTMLMLVAAKLLGATSANLVKYETSAEASGDTSSVVGYAGITIY